MGHEPNGFYTQDAATDPGSDWNGNAYQAHVSFTPATEQPAGTVLTSAVFTDVLPFQTSADQLLVYTGSLSSPTFICALDLAKGYNGYGGDDCKGGTTLSVWPTNVECTGYGSQEKYKYFSELPSGLTAGESALRALSRMIMLRTRAVPRLVALGAAYGDRSRYRLGQGRLGQPNVCHLVHGHGTRTIATTLLACPTRTTLAAEGASLPSASWRPRLGCHG